MDFTASASLAGLPAFLSYFGLGLVLLIIFAVVYVLATPHHEFALIKANKSAAALAFGGSLVGFCLPLRAAMGNSVSLIDFAIWGGIALLIQLAAFFALRLVIDELPQRIARNETATGGFVAAVAVAVGILNAASMS